jgi:integrase
VTTYRRPDSDHWWYSFTIKGQRFRGSTETADRELAKAVEAKLRSEALLGLVTGRKPTMTLDEAFGRYWLEVASRQPSGRDMAYQARNLMAVLGKGTRLDQLGNGDVARFVAKRRAEVADSSVNRELALLRQVLRRAATAWDLEVAMPNWRQHLLTEPDARERILAGDEDACLFAALRPDFHPLFRFALATGQRLRNCTTLTWSQVDLEAGLITFRVKSKRPGGRVHMVPITPAIAAILATERGKHPELVFTYVCQRTVRNRQRGIHLQAGQRYGFSRNGWRKAYMEARQAAGLADLRFHDLRHTAATRVYRASRNLKAVQRLLGHAAIATTMRYIRGDADDVRAAMLAVEAPAPAVPVTNASRPGRRRRATP